MSMSDLSNWQMRPVPELKSVKGRYIQIDPADFTKDGPALFEAISGAGNDDLWRYIPLGPFEDHETMVATLNFVGEQQNWKTHILRSAENDAVLGMASYMRIRPEAGSAEVGAIVFSKKLQRTPAATEAMYLMARYLFDDLGYRRYEWKCNDANAASKRAAERLGFQFEGVFRQDMVMKGENRDTAWFSIIDSEWQRVKAGFEVWLSPQNFDDEGNQRRSLREIRTAL